MQIIRQPSFVRSPWKNGGGVTHEIARDGSDPFGWRLSVADVAVDGAFSLFPGYHRWLTVIEGHGMELVRPSGSLDADPGVPLHFAGDEKIFGRLKDGPCRDFNLIYDPLRFFCSMRRGNEQLRLAPDGRGLVGVLLVRGNGSTGQTQIETGDFVFIDKTNEVSVLTDTLTVAVEIMSRSP